MINIAGKMFRNSGEVAEQVLQVLLGLKPFKSGYEDVNERDYRGLLADSAGYLEAVFVNSYGAISRVSVPTAFLTSTVGELVASAEAEKHREECNKRQANLERIESELSAIEESLVAKRQEFADAMIEQFLAHA